MIKASKMIYYLLYTITLILFWGLLLLDGKQPDAIGVIFGLGYTFYSAFFIRNTVKYENLTLKITKAIGPIFYLISSLILTFQFDKFFFLNPIIIACIIFSISFFYKESFPNITLQFFSISFIFLYSLSLYNYWEISINENSEFDFTNNSTSNPEIVNSHSLFDFNFINASYDTIGLPKNNKYTIIETWNEKCPPCIKALTDLPVFYNSIDSISNQFYIYEPSDISIKLDTEKIFNFNIIQKKEKILLDFNKNMYEALNISGYPYFIVFNPTGKIVFIQFGYDPDKKELLENKIKSLLK